MLCKDTLKEIQNIVREEISTEIGVFKSKVNPPGNENQIADLISVYHIPDEYLNFLRFANGMTLFNLDDIDGYKFFSVEEIIKENKLLADSEEERWTGERIVFCGILGEGNYIAFDLKTKLLLDGFHEIYSDEWETIPLSFGEFLKKLIELKGEKFWLTS